MSRWKDFNDAVDDDTAKLIPKGSEVRVRMTIRPGGYNDENMGLTGGWVKQGKSGALYLDCEFIILEGIYFKRKIFSKIGVWSPKGPAYETMGRSFIRGILSSSRCIASNDFSQKALKSRTIKDFAELHGIEFTARIDVEEDSFGLRNVINRAVVPSGSLGVQRTPQDTYFEKTERATAEAMPPPEYFKPVKPGEYHQHSKELNDDIPF